ncbi:MAG: TonB family protein [Methylococcaceae bacterium]|nr:TonB family protein [Methylococcaceae bacterium]
MSEQSFQRPSPLSSNDTLLVCIFFAAIIHTALILGINFSKPKADKTSKSIEITLVTKEAKKAPEKAEFLAQSNQIGAGEKLDKPTPAAQQLASTGTQRQQPPRQKVIKQQSVQRQQILTQKKAKQKIQLTEKTKTTTEKSKPKISMEALNRQIAELGAKIRYQKPSSDQNRIKFVNSVSAHKYLAAQYVIDWQRKVESTGNLNYPAFAKRPGFSSSLTLDVGINPDGSIYNVRIRKSSGYPALDEAAKRIVRVSAPFPALPNELLQELDILVITRVWKFSDETGLHTR